MQDRVFWLGVQGGFEMSGIGLTIRLGMSELGPLGVFLSASIPGGVVIVPQIGLALNDFAAGVEFFSTLPSYDDPFDLQGSASGLPTEMTPEQWLVQLKQQVANQYNMLKANPGMNGFAAAFTSPMTIIGSCRIYSIYTSQAVFNGQVIVKFSTDGKFMIVGQLNFANDMLSVSAKLYADLSKIASGSATVLFLAKIPDQVDVLTIYGSLKMGFRSPTGEEIDVEMANLAAAPTADLAGPRNGDTVGIGTVNNRGYLDVNYASLVLPDHVLDVASVTDLGAEFTLGGAGVGTLAVDTLQKPVLINEGTKTFRYWTVGEPTNPAALTVTFVADSWFMTNMINGDKALNTAQPAAGLNFSHVSIGYLDVVYIVPEGRTLDTSFITGDEFTVNGQPTAGTPTRMPGRKDIYRYYLAGDLAAGEVTVVFAAGAWQDSAHIPNPAETEVFTVAVPQTKVVGPFNGGSIDVAVLNGMQDAGRKYIDVVYQPPPGSVLDYASIFDPAAEFALTAGGAIGLEATPIPMKVEMVDGLPVTTALVRADAEHPGETEEQFRVRLTEDGVTRFRYRFSAAYTYNPSVATMAFTAGGWSESSHSQVAASTFTFRVEGPTADLVSPLKGASVDIAVLNAQGYLDVRFTPTYSPSGGPSKTVTAASITNVGGGYPCEITLAGPAAEGRVTINNTTAPTATEQPGVYRYTFTGSFTTGEVTVTFEGNRFTDSAGLANITEVETFTVVGPVANLESPRSGGSIGADALNNRSYLDVSLHVPAGHLLDPASVIDLDPEFTLSGAGLGSGPHAVHLDATQSPVLVNAGTNTYRYWVVGEFVAGAVNVTFTSGSWASKAPEASAATGVVYSATLAVTAPGVSYIDVTFRATGSNQIMPGSITDVGGGSQDTEFSLSGAGAAGVMVRTDLAPTQIPSTNIYRFYVTGTFGAGEVVVAFVGGSWQDSGGYTNLAKSESFLVHELTAVLANPVQGSVIDLAALNAQGYLDISFGKHNGTSLVPSSIDGDEISLRGPGRGTAAINAATSGELIDADTNTYRYYFTGSFAAGYVTVSFNEDSWTDEAGNAGTAGAMTFHVYQQAQADDAGGRVFFIELAGGMQLDAFGLLEEGQHLMEIRGRVVLEIDFERGLVTLDMSGTMKLYKIGNVASAAGHFVLDNTHQYSDSPQFWGVLAFETNLTALEPFGVKLYGACVLMINTGGNPKTETLTLEGIPGDEIDEEIEVTDPSMEGNLPTGFLETAELHSDWGAFFEDELGITLTEPTVTKAVSGEFPRWRVDDGGRQYFICKEPSGVDESMVLRIRGEQRVYELPAESFSIEIAGMLKVAPDKDWANPVFEMSGAFYLKISSTRFEVFAMARLKAPSIDFRVKGLLIMDWAMPPAAWPGISWAKPRSTRWTTSPRCPKTCSGFPAGSRSCSTPRRWTRRSRCPSPSCPCSTRVRPPVLSSTMHRRTLTAPGSSPRATTNRCISP